MTNNFLARAKFGRQHPALNAATEMLCSWSRVAGAAVAKLAYAAGLKSAGDFPVVGSSPTSRTITGLYCGRILP